MTKLISSLNLPHDLKKLDNQQLNEIAGEIRRYMVKTVSDNGGHLAASLGVVELTLALHSYYSSPKDKIIWDVGHQAYPHKILTGRWKQFPTLRKHNGLSGFPKPDESEHDPFITGHSSTSISVALGLAKAGERHKRGGKVIAVIGDGALTGGMAYEALNHAGHIKANIVVILNDNEMSISYNVGSMSAYLGRIRSDPKYSRLKKDFEYYANRVPFIGKKMVSLAERIKGGLKYVMMPGMLFEELGFTYFGPVDGHNIAAMKKVLKQAEQMDGPVLIHVLTEKGKGYRYAEQSPELFHGIGPFDLNNGLPRRKQKSLTYTDIFGQTMLKMAQADNNLVAITAAMTQGTGLNDFANRFPDRFYDVGIAEQHAVTFAAALASGGLRPVVAIYSTFLQRAYDQIIHDTCLQKLPVIFAVDRAGIVGEDGETHQGLFDLSYLRNAPNMSIMAPANENELQQMLYTALDYDQGPVAIRYPRSKVSGVKLENPQPLQWGKGELLKKGGDLLLLAIGTMVNPALEAADRLLWQGIRAAVINARFVKPLDEELIIQWADQCRYVVTLEENIISGGFGSAVADLLHRKGLNIKLKCLGINDVYVEQGTREQMLSLYGFDVEGIVNSVACTLKEHVGKGIS